MNIQNTKMYGYFRDISFEKAFIYYNIFGTFFLAVITGVIFVLLRNENFDPRYITGHINVIYFFCVLALLFISRRNAQTLSRRDVSLSIGLYLIISILSFLFIGSFSPMAQTGHMVAIAITTKII